MFKRQVSSLSRRKKANKKLIATIDKKRSQSQDNYIKLKVSPKNFTTLYNCYD